MAEKPRLWAQFARLAEPHADVNDEEIRRRTRLILTICLIGLPVEALDFLTAWAYEPRVGLNLYASYAISVVTVVSIVATYLLARSRRPQWSFPVFCALISAIGWLIVFQGAGTPFHDAILSYADFAIVITALFGGPLLISAITLANVAMVFLEPASHGPELYARMTFATTYVLTGGFLIITAVMRANDTKTIRHRTAEAQESEERFRTLAQSSMEGIILGDNGVIVDVNDAACSLFGYTRDEFLLMRQIDLIAPEHRAEDDRRVRTNADATFEMEAVRKDGTRFLAAGTGRPLRRGDRMLRVSTFRDVSAEHAIRDRLEQASRDAKAASQAKSNFLATISHELRTPLNAVLGYAQLLEAENQDPKARDMLGSMRASSEHLLSIVSDILDFTKSDDGGISLLPTGVDPRALLAEAVARQRTAAKEKGLQLTLFEPPTPCPRVLMDGRRFQQIADHLLDNAVRFTAHGQVDARLEWAEEARGLLLSVAVRDTGPGIAADLQPRLFSPFTQGDGSMTRQHGGLGIGLAVSRRIAKAMDGDLQVSTGPGGTTMTLQVRVPRDPAPPPATPASPVSTPPVTNGHNGPLPNAALEARVLVAEDDPVNQKVIGRMLEKCGQTVALVSDGLQAVEAAGTKPYKLILMDVHMPNLDGLEATRRIRAAGNKVSIVALTADALVGDRQKCLEAGMDEYLSKPVRLDDLRKTIERFVTAR